MVAAIVGFCLRRPWPVVVIGAALLLVSGAYAATHFKINTDTERLLPKNLSWQKHQAAYVQAFPQGQILAVIDAAGAPQAYEAANRLTERLQQDKDHFVSVRGPQTAEFLQRHALLYMTLDQVTATVQRLREAQPVIAVLAADPSLRGVMQLVSIGVEALQRRRLPSNALLPPLTKLGDALDNALADRPVDLSWAASLSPPSAAPAAAMASHKRAFVRIEPVLDFAAVQPGRAATDAIRHAFTELRLDQDFGARLRLTGRAPINDAQFATLGNDAIPGIVGTIIAVLAILWLALRSARIIGAVFATLLVGLAITTALGLALVGAFNLISIAFAVLFAGLGADFGIQYAVRYRGERHRQQDLAAALRDAGAKSGGPLALAAAGTAVGFFCFLPTQYRGVAELGEIAGIGMLVAFALTITLLPAFLALAKPPDEPHSMRLPALAPLDRFFARHRIAVVVGTIAVVLLGAPLLWRIDFDFDPIHLQDPTSEAVTTYRELAGSPEIGINGINVMVPKAADTDAAEHRLAALPEAAGTRSINGLLPADQPAKLRAIEGAAAALGPSLERSSAKPAPSDNDNVEAIRRATADLRRLEAVSKGDGAAAVSRVIGMLDRLGQASAEQRAKVEAALVTPLKRDLDGLRGILRAETITVASLPAELARDWIAADGRARIEVLPKAGADDTAGLRRFANAVLAMAPTAAGTPVALVQSQRTVLRAFIQAGVLAIVAIGLILWLALRRITDVLLTLVPLLVAGAVTLEIMGLTGEPLNFANVIALPLLLGVGVAFKIYYIMAWRAGRTDLLQSTLTRAVFFSALTTATAFGSLWLSPPPGMSSMGKLMALSLLCTMAAAVLFQPALMGPPRQRRRQTEVAAAPVSAPPPTASPTPPPPAPGTSVPAEPPSRRRRPPPRKQPPEAA